MPEQDKEWHDCDELEMLPGIGYVTRSWIIEQLEKEQAAEKGEGDG